MDAICTNLSLGPSFLVTLLVPIYVSKTKSDCIKSKKLFVMNIWETIGPFAFNLFLTLKNFLLSLIDTNDQISV